MIAEPSTITEHPLLLATAMVQAVLQGKKTATRRPVTAANSTVLGSCWPKSSPAWRGLYFDRAIVRTQSTLLRCVVGPDAPHDLHLDVPWKHPDDEGEPDCVYRVRPRWEIGERLWVRETWCPVNNEEFGGTRWIDYRATPWDSAEHPAGWQNAPDDPEALKWKPSIHMPRSACRLVLEITGIGAERVCAITREGAAAEGMCADFDPVPPWLQTHRWPEENFRTLWESIYGADSWREWCWVFEFKEP